MNRALDLTAGLLLFDILEVGLFLLGDVVFLDLARKSLEVPALLDHLGFVLLGDRVGVGADGGVGFLVDVFKVFSHNSFLNESGELTLEGPFILIEEGLHVLGNVLSKDVFSVDFSVQFLTLIVPARESLLTVGNIQPSINSSLQHTKNPGSRGGSVKTNIQHTMERFWLSRGFLHTVVVSIHIRLTLIDLIQSQFLEEPSGQEESGAVSSRIVGETNLNPITRKFMGVGGTNDNVSLNPGVGNLSRHILVGEPHHHPVLGGVVFILILDDKPLPRIVIRPSFPAPLELNLESLEVSLVLHHLNETHD